MINKIKSDDKKKNEEKIASVAAVSTPTGAGGIAVVRVSGPDALEIAFKILKKDNKKSELKVEPRRFYNFTAETGSIKDEVMVVYFKAPKSYTGEDVVEIQCHGNGIIADEILKALILNGARAAENGEFTKRAFLNHRIDLSQAESVIDLINAQSVSEINAAYDNMSGGLHKKLTQLQNTIAESVAAAQAAVDYPEEDIEEESKDSLEIKIKGIKKELQELVETYGDAVMIKEGIKIAIAGKPNVGKSMLLNALTKTDRAIVTDIPGTTRDTVEEQYSYKGLRFIITDTAGIRRTEDIVEKKGIERTYNALKGADIILAVAEAGENFAEEIPLFKPVIYVYNKTDLKPEIKKFKNETDAYIYVSAKENFNIEELKEKIYLTVNGAKINASGTRLNNVRHYNAAVEALNALNRAESNLRTFTLDCIISDLHHSYRALGQITGAVSSDNIISEIFKRFCVGK